jgi:hypothetical protein
MLCLTLVVFINKLGLASRRPREFAFRDTAWLLETDAVTGSQFPVS